MSRALKLIIVALGLGTAVLLFSRVSARAPSTAAVVSNDPGAFLLSEAKRAERSGVLVETSGLVTGLDQSVVHDSVEQRIFLQLTPDLSVPVVLGLRGVEPVPARIGDRVRVRGWYHWNEQGGVLLGSHTDATGVERGGWILHRGRFYEAAGGLETSVARAGRITE